MTEKLLNARIASLSSRVKLLEAGIGLQLLRIEALEHKASLKADAVRIPKTTLKEMTQGLDKHGHDG